MTRTDSEMPRRSSEEEIALSEIRESIRKSRLIEADTPREADASRETLKHKRRPRSRVVPIVGVILVLAALGALLGWLINTSPPTAAPVAWQTTASALGTLLAVAISVSVAVVESSRTRRAQQETRDLREEQEARQRREIAARIAGWIDDKYSPNADGSVYIRTVHAVLANTSSEPVFDVNVSIGLAWPSRLSLGPLSIPKPLVTLPPGRELRWDISIPLLAHDINPAYPLAVETGFTDPNGLRWTRTFEGKLVETTGDVATLFDSDDDEAMYAQIGRLDPYNPLAVAFAFINALTSDDGIDRELFEQTVAPEASGWNDVTDDQLEGMADELRRFGVAAYVHYPAPHVAYVKIVAQEHEKSQITVGDSLEIRANIIMLTFRWGRGWRVFSYGGGLIPPNQIEFPAGELIDDNRLPYGQNS